MKYWVVLVRPQGPINIGMVCRLVANLGAAGVRLVQPACELDTAETRMFAHHGQPVLKDAQVFASLPEAVADCDFVIGTTARRRRDTLPIFGPQDIASECLSRDAEAVALVFGSEVNGLTEDELLACTAGVQLATPGFYPSYNLSQAVAITLYLAVTGAPSEAEATASPGKPSAGGVRMITHAEEGKLVDYWLTTLRDTGYFRRTETARFAPKLQRMIGRLRLGVQDMHLLWGMLAHFRENDATEKHSGRK